jgi:hypothetical protein
MHPLGTCPGLCFRVYNGLVGSNPYANARILDTGVRNAKTSCHQIP